MNTARLTYSIRESIAVLVLVLAAALITNAQTKGKINGTEGLLSHSEGRWTHYLLPGSGAEERAHHSLLHGLPSSSRMFQPLLTRLADSYHLVAPDYPGYGHSDWPDPKPCDYTFDNIASVMHDFTLALGLPPYTLYMRRPGGRLAFVWPWPTQSAWKLSRGDYLNLLLNFTGNRFGKGLCRPGGVLFDIGCPYGA